MPTGEGFCGRPRIDPLLTRTFKKIGTPGPEPFRPDPFQLEALAAISDHDVLVSAPTGSGKTWIAQEAISRCLSKGMRSWYASPLKALSNAIYEQFSQHFGTQACGILTGDRKENPGAPVIVGTTEILRNQLYDAMHQGTSIETDLVILDEAHYLSDPDRGVVWEEVLIYLSSRVRILLLSATISNGEEIAAWLRENRGTGIRVVRSYRRPVPLEMLFLFPDGLISPLSGKRGLVPRVKKHLDHPGKIRQRFRFGDVIRCLKALDLLPAIFFLKSRADCDRALLSCQRSEKPWDQRERCRREAREFLRKYPHLERHRHLHALMECSVASHHAGQLPYWKVFVERMMAGGCLEAIFSTSTVAAGVNFPARTVVLVQSDRFDGRRFSDLTATELHQMTGRAGRRGKDNIGFAVLLPGAHQDPELIHQLKNAAPEPLVSQIQINFSMTLNLLLSHSPEGVRDLLGRSFASFQQRKMGTPVLGRWLELVEALKARLPEGRCDTADPYEVLEYMTKMEERKKHPGGSMRGEKAGSLQKDYRPWLVPGRAFLHRNGKAYVIVAVSVIHGKWVYACHNLDTSLRIRKGVPSFKKVTARHIQAVFDFLLDLRGDESPEQLKRLFESVPQEGLKKLSLDETVAGGWNRSMERLPCEDCNHERICRGPEKKELERLLKSIRDLGGSISGMGEIPWLNFKRHLRFLKETGFVDEKDRLTLDGEWASKLRLDYPLLIAEAIRRGGFADLSPPLLAGCFAPFVWDRYEDTALTIETAMNLSEIWTAFQVLLDKIEGIRLLKVKRGFENPQVSFWPAAALYLWARGRSWGEVATAVPVDEGDLASLIVRTVDHLRQVSNLEKSHPDLAAAAAQGISLIMRDPVYID